MIEFYIRLSSVNAVTVHGTRHDIGEGLLFIYDTHPERGEFVKAIYVLENICGFERIIRG